MPLLGSKHCYFIIINQGIIYKGWQYYFSFPEIVLILWASEQALFRTETICLYSQALRMIYYIFMWENCNSGNSGLLTFFKNLQQQWDMFPDKSNVTWWTINLLFIFLLLGNNTRSAKDISKRVLVIMEIKWCTTQNVFSIIF